MDSPYRNWISCDCETGGLPNTKLKAFYDFALTEVAFVVVSQELEIIDQASWLIKPYKEGLVYDPRAAEASGITKQMCIEEGRDLVECQKEMAAFLKKYKYGGKLPVMFGHNFVKFDAAFMIGAFEFCKDDLMKYVNPEPEDTMKWARMAWTTSDNYKLGTCCSNAGVTLKDAHRALTDTIATAKLWVYFQKLLRGQGQTQSAKLETVTKFRDNFEL